MDWHHFTGCSIPQGGAPMLRGIANVRFHTSDLEAARRWYTEVLGVAPYFERPGYAELRFGDYRQVVSWRPGTGDRAATPSSASATTARSWAWWTGSTS